MTSCNKPRQEIVKTYKVVLTLDGIEFNVLMPLVREHLSITIDNLVMLAKEQVKKNLIFNRLEEVK